MKFTQKQRIRIYKERKQGATISSLALKYGVNPSYLKYLIALIDNHGLAILNKSKSECYNSADKLVAIKKVINNHESCRSVSIDLGLLSSHTLRSWIQNYKDNDYNIIEKKRGRIPMPKKKANIKKDDDELESLRQENEYLKVELEYSKKLRAVIQKRINQQPKKK